MLTRRNEQGLQHSLYCRQFMLTAAYKWNTIEMRISLKWIQKCNVMKTNVGYCISLYKKKVFTKKSCTGRCREVIIFGSWGRTLVAVTAERGVERFKQELMYGLSARTKKCGRCREVAVSGGSTVLFSNVHGEKKGLKQKHSPNLMHGVCQPGVQIRPLKTSLDNSLLLQL